MIRILALGCFAAVCVAQKPAKWQDPSPHSVQFLTVDRNIQLEVLDWGGSGRPLILLAGQGNTAHVFDDFAAKLTAAHHVYGITRRGYGASSAPASGYSAGRLGDDVIAVLTSLQLNRPVLIGHSIGGEELSSVGTRHPEKIAGLIYLDASYDYAFYDPSRGYLPIDLVELQDKLALLTRTYRPTGSPPLERDLRELQRKLKHFAIMQTLEGVKPKATLAAIRDLLQTYFPPVETDLRQMRTNLDLVEELWQTDIPRFRKDLQQFQKSLEAGFGQPVPPAPTAVDRASFPALRSWETRVDGITTPEAEWRQQYEAKPDGRVGKPHSHQAVDRAVSAGQQKFTSAIRVPVLAIYSLPQKDANAVDAADTEAQAKAFENGMPSARVVRVPNANHYVFLSNEAEVLREMRSFLGSLP